MNDYFLLPTNSSRFALLTTALFLATGIFAHSADAQVSPGKFSGKVADTQFEVLGNCEVSGDSFKFRTLDAVGLADTNGDGIFVLVNRIEDDWIMRVVKDGLVLFNGLSGQFTKEGNKYSLDASANGPEGKEDVNLQLEINCE